MRSRSWRFRNLLTTSAPNVNDTPRSFSPQPCTSLSGSDHSRSHRRPAEDSVRGEQLRNAALYWTPGHTVRNEITKNSAPPPPHHTHLESPSKTIRGSERGPLPGSVHRYPYTGVCSSCSLKHNVHTTDLLVLHGPTPVLREGGTPHTPTRCVTEETLVPVG